MQNKNHWWKIFLSLWAFLFTYLLIMNSGIFPLTIKYDITGEEPFISKLWPRSAYEIQGNKLLVKDSIYLDLKTTIDFEELYIYLEGEFSEDLEIKIVLKENFESGPVVIQELKQNDWTFLDLSTLGPKALLVISLESALSYQINELILKFKQPKWQNLFK